MSATQAFVDSFAIQMERKLDVNRHKGDREGWLRDSNELLLARLAEEVGELIGAVLTNQPIQRVIDEAADVGNFAMMIADKYQFEQQKAA